MPRFQSDTYPAILALRANLAGKGVFVVGSGMIGQAMAIASAKAGTSYFAIGAQSKLTPVVVPIRKAAQDADRKHPRVLSITVDTSSAASIGNAAALVQASYGGINYSSN
ncbi:MAG: hypothetical protein Q9171_000506 [Xanthocarpia ochracea]